MPGCCGPAVQPCSRAKGDRRPAAGGRGAEMGAVGACRQERSMPAAWRSTDASTACWGCQWRMRQPPSWHQMLSTQARRHASACSHAACTMHGARHAHRLHPHGQLGLIQASAHCVPSSQGINLHRALITVNPWHAGARSRAARRLCGKLLLLFLNQEHTHQIQHSDVDQERRARWLVQLDHACRTSG
jgi:hypothetical protein